MLRESGPTRPTDGVAANMTRAARRTPITGQTLAPNAVPRNDFSGVATLPGPVWTSNGPPSYYWAASSNASYVPVCTKCWTGTNEPTWVAASERWYVYDGMLVVQERDKNNVPRVSYTRGLDLSGSRQGAGGIGGLLARSEHGTSSPYAISRTDCYHADGNGNITALVDTNSALSASYQYDPYGDVMSSSGDLKDANVYRFSSKMFHATSDLYYYGYRFYDPNLQRWLNRDPIGEVGFETVRRASGPPIGDRPSLRPAVARGGPNLYAFCHNRPTTLWDAYGLSACTDMCDQQYQANLASCSKAAKCVAAGLGAGGAVLGTVIWGPWGGVVVGGIDAGGGWLVTIDACVSGAIVARASCYLGCISVEW